MATTVSEFGPAGVIEPALAPRRISVGAFFDRFGAHKYPILASADPMVQALVRDCTVRSYIDLDNPQLPAGVALLVSAGFALDAQAVIHAPITDDERPGT